MIKTDSKFFNIEDTLYCGQLFRFSERGRGYRVYAGERAADLYYEGGLTVVDSDDDAYFENYFDLGRDYSAIYERALSFNIPFLTEAANSGKGIRILKQDCSETIFSFLTSQNNNIPRIKSILERLCAAAGESREFRGDEYKTFPTAESLTRFSEADFNAMGLGYRAAYFVETARALSDGAFLAELRGLSAKHLKERLLSLKGVGPKVADCIMLFGFSKTDSFPVDTWVEKIYRENFGGTLTDRKKISDYFVSEFGEYSGFFQQYLFYLKRGK